MTSRDGARPPAAASDNLRGILWMLASIAGFTVMGLIMKHLSTTVPVAVIVFFRQWVVLVLLVPWLARADSADIRTRHFGIHVLRALFSLTSSACMVYALGKLPLADAMALVYTNPLWSIPVSVILLKEAVRIRRWTATAAGFVGVLLIVKPGGAIDPAMLVALASALTAALAMAMIRQAAFTDSPHQILLYFSLIGSVASLGPAIYFWRTPAVVEILWMLAMGMTAYVGQLCVARAIALAEVTLVAPLDFLRMPMAALLGLLLFDERPDAWTLAGIGIIGASTAYIAHREATLRRRPAGGSPPSGG